MAITGVANDLSTYLIGVALIPSESIEDMTWAIQQVLNITWFALGFPWRVMSCSPPFFYVVFLESTHQYYGGKFILRSADAAEEVRLSACLVTGSCCSD